MNKRARKGHYPEAMLDMGMPQEMSTYSERATAEAAAPFLEVSQPFELGEGLEEIRRPEDFAEDL